jgi:hypothetical protein
MLRAQRKPQLEAGYLTVTHPASQCWGQKPEGPQSTPSPFPRRQREATLAPETCLGTGAVQVRGWGTGKASLEECQPRDTKLVLIC